MNDIWAQIEYNNKASAKRAIIWANNTVFQCGNQCIKVKARFGWRQTVS